MERAKKTARRIGITILGFAVLILGLILIPLPGPGILVCLVGLTILSWEFEWALRHKNNAQGHLTKLLEKSGAKKKKSPKNNS